MVGRPLPAARVPGNPEIADTVLQRARYPDVIEPAAAAGGQRLVSLHTPVEQASTTQILGSGPDAAGAVVDLLAEIGVLP